MCARVTILSISLDVLTRTDVCHWNSQSARCYFLLPSFLLSLHSLTHSFLLLPPFHPSLPSLLPSLPSFPSSPLSSPPPFPSSLPLFPSPSPFPSSLPLLPSPPPFPSSLPLPSPPLLSQFNVTLWLESYSPNLAERSQMLDFISQGLTLCGPKPTQDGDMLVEVRTTSTLGTNAVQTINPCAREFVIDQTLNRLSSLKV